MHTLILKNDQGELRLSAVDWISAKALATLDSHGLNADWPLARNGDEKVPRDNALAFADGLERAIPRLPEVVERCVMPWGVPKTTIRKLIDFCRQGKFSVSP